MEAIFGGIDELQMGVVYGKILRDEMLKTKWIYMGCMVNKIHMGDGSSYLGM